MVVVFPTPFTADHQHHERPLQRRGSWNLAAPGQRLEGVHHVFAQCFEHRRAVCEPISLEPLVEVGDHDVGQVHPDIGSEEDLLHLVDEGGIDLPSPGEQLREAAREVLPGPLEGGAKTPEDSGAGLVGWRRHVRGRSVGRVGCGRSGRSERVK